jgi:hypothetical protein
LKKSETNDLIDQLRVKLHNFKTKDQSEKGSQLQGCRWIFGRDAIELIFTIKITIEDAIEQITN